MIISTFKIEDQDEVIALWGRCGLLTAKNDPIKDIKRKFDHSPDLFLVGRINGRIVASVWGGYEGRRGWINNLCVEPRAQHMGYGGQIVAAIEEKIFALGAPKINLQIRQTNKQAIGFYQSIGYADDQVFSMAKRKPD